MTIHSRLANNDSVREEEAQWQYEFIHHVLSTIGIPEEILEECFPEDLQDLTVEHKIALRRNMNKFDIAIVDDRDGGIKIFLEKDLIAEWKKCKFILKEDSCEVDPAKRLYTEIQADVWTKFEG